MIKRKPLLYDLVTADPAQLDFTRHSVTARRFVLDDEAIRYVGEMIKNNPRLIIDGQDFAKPMYSKMWIEFPARVLYETITGIPSQTDSDEVVGYYLEQVLEHDGIANMVDSVTGQQASLFEKLPEPGYKVWIYAGSQERGSVSLPHVYILNRPMTLEGEILTANICGTSRAQLGAYMWGSSFDAFDKDNLEAERALRSRHSVLFAPMFGKDWKGTKLSADGYKMMMESSAGDLRNILALLLVLNRTRVVQTVKSIGHGSAMIKRKPRPLATHDVISFKLDPAPIIRNLLADSNHEGTAAHRRLHDVKGHFAHDAIARDAFCVHATWETLAPQRWRCTSCGGKRWWRREHQRGDETIGVYNPLIKVTL